MEISKKERERILKLHESYKERNGYIIREQTEKIYDKYDRGYDYKVSNGKWVASKKGQNKWFSLEKYPKSIQRLDTKYPDARTTKRSSSTGTRMAGRTSGLDGITTNFNNKSSSSKSSSGSSVPFKNKTEGNAFRQWINDTYPKYAKKIDLDKTGSYDNKYIRKAWKEYGKEYEDGKKNEGGDKSFDFEMPNIINTLKSLYHNIITGEKSWSFEPTKGNFVIPFVFPEYEPKIDAGADDEWITPITKFLYGTSGKKGTYGKLGHAGIATVLPNGSVSMFEYGRYRGAKKGMGITKSKSLGRIAKMDKDGLITNFKSVAEKIKKNSEGDGPRLSMDAKLVPSLDSSAGISHAKQTTSKPYEGFDLDATDNDANCGTYTVEVARAAGVPLGVKCMPNPTAILHSFDEYSLESVKV